MQISLTGATDIGQLRRANEDSFGLIPSRDTLVVCDGMGGHAAGEVASGRAVETVEAYLTHGDRLPHIDMPNSGEEKLFDDAVDLVWAVRLANRRVFQIAQSQQQMHGMGTTLVSARFSPGIVTVCHVGDSRAYRLSGGTFEPVTIDHSLVAELLARGEINEEQARTFTERNIITRALGTRPSVAVDVNILPAVAGDWYILCSDGLCGVIEDQAMADVLSHHTGNPDAAMAALIAAANEAGGPDNITVGIAVIDDPGTASVVPERSARTIAESTEAAMSAENHHLLELFGNDSEDDESSLDDANTDKIPINIAKPPDSQR